MPKEYKPAFHWTFVDIPEGFQFREATQVVGTKGRLAITWVRNRTKFAKKVK